MFEGCSAKQQQVDKEKFHAEDKYFNGQALNINSVSI